MQPSSDAGPNWKTTKPQDTPPWARDDTACLHMDASFWVVRHWARAVALCGPAFPSKQLSILWASTGQRPTICNFSHSAAFYATHYFGVLAVTSTSMSIPGHASALMT